MPRLGNRWVIPALSTNGAIGKLLILTSIQTRAYRVFRTVYGSWNVPFSNICWVLWVFSTPTHSVCSSCRAGYDQSKPKYSLTFVIETKMLGSSLYWAVFSRLVSSITQNSRKTNLWMCSLAPAIAPRRESSDICNFIIDLISNSESSWWYIVSGNAWST